MERICPNCSKIMIYKSTKSYNQAIANNKLCMSCTVKEKWQDPEYREKQIKKQIESHLTEEYKEKCSIRMKELWQDPEYREKQIKKSKELWQDSEYREKQIQKSKELWQDPEYREKQIKKQIESHLTEEYKEKCSIRMKEKWQDPEYRETRKMRFNIFEDVVADEILRELLDLD